MLTCPPLPYGLVATPRFAFPALAEATRCAPLGGPRETALACLQGARLAAATLPPYELGAELRRRRGEASLAWLGALVLPAEVRPPLTALFTAAAQGPSPALRDALRALPTAAAGALSVAAADELLALASAIPAGEPAGEAG